MKHAVIFAHPRARSFTAAVAETYAGTARLFGDDVEIRDLYRIGFDPCLRASEIPEASVPEPEPDVTAERELLKDRGVFALVYPFWLNAPPAMIKGYLDRVFGFGFAYGSNGHSFTPLLGGRKLISFTSSGAPTQWVEQTGAFAAEQTLFNRYFATLCGMTTLAHIHFGGVVNGASPSFVKARLGDVERAVIKYFGR